MLRSSLGFHTMSLFLRLTRDEAEQLIKHFCNYRKRTGLVRMLMPKSLPGGKKEWREYIPVYIYDGTTFLPPSELKISYFDKHKDRGIKWMILSDSKNKAYSEYIVSATINPKILGGTHDYITAANCDDMDIAIRNFNRISKSISPLLGAFEYYSLRRIDYCINFFVNELAPGCTTEQIMNLIRRGDIPPHYKERMEYDETAHRKKASPDSFYLENKSVTINCYRKSVELQNRKSKGLTSITQTTIDEAQDIIRFEVQCKYHKVYNIFRLMEESSSYLNKFFDILGYKACLVPINHYYKVTIGAGDWFSLSMAQRIIKGQGFNKQKCERLLNVLKEVNQCRSLTKAKAQHQGNDLAAFKRTINDLADIGINPVTIPREWGIDHIPNLLHTFIDMDQARLVCPEIHLI